MKHVAPVRKELGFRTIFNLLGPLCNPAQRAPPAARRVRGAMGRAASLMCLRSSVPNTPGSCMASDGMDEMTITGASDVDRGRRTEVSRRFVIDAEELGL